jgi:hypothetical protein
VSAAQVAPEVQARGTLVHARQRLDAARSCGDLVVFVHLAFDAKHRNRTNRTFRFDEHERAQRYMAGSADSAIVSELAPSADELVLDKGSVGPFASTILDAVLHAASVEQLAICGVATHLAVKSAAREASDRGRASRPLPGQGAACLRRDHHLQRPRRDQLAQRTRPHIRSRDLTGIEASVRWPCSPAARDPHTRARPPVRMGVLGFLGSAVCPGLDRFVGGARMPGAGMLPQPPDPPPA